MIDYNGISVSHEELIHDIIGHIYDAALDRSAWYTVLEAIASLTASKSAILLYQDHKPEHTSVLSSYGFDAKWLTLYDEEHGAIDPVYEIMVEAAVAGELVAISCVNRDKGDMFCESRTYQEFYKPQGVFHLAGTCLIQQENSSTWLGFQRTKSAPEYQPDILSLVKKLVPHLQKALHIYRRHTEAVVKNDAFASSTDTMQMGAVFFNHQCQISYCNKSASAIINQHPAIAMQNQHVFATIDECDKKLRSAIIAASQANLDGAFINSIAVGLKSPDSLAILPVLITPIHQSNFSPYISEGAIAAVMTLTDPDHILLTSPELLSTIYNLTKSEADVAIALANAMSVKDIAEEKGVQLTTIRSQVQSIYAKMDVKTQAQLIKTLLYSPLTSTK